MGLADNAARKKTTPKKTTSTNNRPGGNSMGAPQRYTPPPPKPKPAPMSAGTRTGAGGYKFTYSAPSSRANATNPNQITADRYEAYDRVANRQADAALRNTQMPPAPAMPGAPGSGGGGGGGGGYGGGGGGLDPAQFNAYSAAMMKLIAGMNQPQAPLQNPLLGMVDPAVDADVAAARQAFSGLGQQISTADPYAALQQSRAQQLGPEMEAFLRGQGVGTGDYGSAVAAQNAELSAGDANWQNLSKVLGTNHVTGQQGRIDNARIQGETIAQGLEGQRTSLHAMAKMQQLELEKQARAEAYQRQQEQTAAIMNLMQTGLQYGQTPDISALLAQIQAPTAAPVPQQTAPIQRSPKPIASLGSRYANLGSPRGGGPQITTMPVRPGAQFRPKGI
jgi:hypothetical protein